MGGSSTQRLSSLAKDQQKILNQSWDNYMGTVYPAAIQQLQNPTSVKDATLGKTMDVVNKSYETAKTNVAAGLAKRGLLGNASGVEGAANTMLESQRANTISSAYQNVLLADEQQKMQQRQNALSMLMSKSPTPTQAAPILAETNDGLLDGLSKLGAPGIEAAGQAATGIIGAGAKVIGGLFPV